MYPINTCVMHLGEGVCRVEDIRSEKFPGTDTKQYYILRPLYENTATTVFLPIDSEARRLRPLLTREQIRTLLKIAPKAEPLWLDNDRLRQETFSRLLREGDPEMLLRLMLELQTCREERTARGKKLRFFDEHILMETQRLISQEYAHVWGVDRQEALRRLDRLRG